jgi:hypothetical protein
MLARTLDEPVAAMDDMVQRRHATRRRIIRLVEDMIPRETGDRGESLDAERRERLDADEFEGEIDPQIVAEIFAEICRDLGLAEVPEMPAWTSAAADGGRESWGRAEGVGGEGERGPAGMGACVPDG